VLAWREGDQLTDEKTTVELKKKKKKKKKQK